ncbi:MAG: hypothetical protein JOZ29_12895 [Deltaproteobacteria bacterium]|nr:hypothetical protein [Deltaproteobacteria bacterium]
MNLVGILAAPFTTVSLNAPSGPRIWVVVISVVLLAIAVALSKRGSIAEEGPAAGAAKAAA